MFIPDDWHFTYGVKRAGHRIVYFCVGVCTPVVTLVRAAIDENLSIRKQHCVMFVASCGHITNGAESADSRIVDFGAGIDSDSRLTASMSSSNKNSAILEHGYCMRLARRCHIARWRKGTGSGIVQLSACQKSPSD